MDRAARAAGGAQLVLSTQAELAKLQPPPDYEGPYSQFLSNRQLALAALERLQKAARKKNRAEYVVAYRDFALRKIS